MRVLEIGCGSGAYTTFVARAVGPDGIVEALDIQPAMLAQLEKKLTLPENSDIKNIRTHQASAYELPFENGSIDLVYMVTVLPEIPDHGRTLAEIKRVLNHPVSWQLLNSSQIPIILLAKLPSGRGRMQD